MMEWFSSNPLTLIGLVLWAFGILWLMPTRQGGKQRVKIPGLLLTTTGLVTFCLGCGNPESALADEVMFWVFGIGALLCGVLMITARNPVYAALWFALATLATCGLFLLQSAPFLAAATIIVYAGAVIVTFLFVIMLAQQSGAAGYDQRSGQSILATVAAFVFLGAIAMTLQSEKLSIEFPADPAVAAVADAVPSEADSGAPDALLPAQPGNLLSVADADHPVGNLKGLGRSLFGDYLFAVELAGTLLLVACIGAIAIAPRREQGGL